MKSYNAFLVFVVVTVVGQVHSRAASGVSVITLADNNEVDPQCPLEATATNLPSVLLTMQYDCYKPTASFLLGLNLASSLNNYRKLFQDACAQELSVRTCISEVASNSNACLNKMEGKMFETVRDHVDNSISAVCNNGSERVARLYSELQPLSVRVQLAVVSCISAMAVKSAYENETDLPAYTMRRYAAMKEALNCIKEVTQDAGGSSTAFEAFVEPLIASMKCISHSTEQIVLCETLITENVLDIIVS